MRLLRGNVVGGKAEVILDIAVARDRLRDVPFKFVENHAVRLVQDVHQDVEPAPVGHAHHDLAHPPGSRTLDDRVQERNQHLPALKREPLLSRVVLLQEGLEQLGRVQFGDDPPFLLETQLRLIPHWFHPVQEPLAYLAIADMHEFDADRPAVGLPKNRD